MPYLSRPLLKTLNKHYYLCRVSNERKPTDTHHCYPKIISLIATQLTHLLISPVY